MQVSPEDRLTLSDLVEEMDRGLPGHLTLPPRIDMLASPPQVVLLYDEADRHEVAVGFADGRVERVYRDQFEYLRELSARELARFVVPRSFSQPGDSDQTAAPPDRTVPDAPSPTRRWRY